MRERVFHEPDLTRLWRDGYQESIRQVAERVVVRTIDPRLKRTTIPILPALGTLDIDRAIVADTPIVRSDLTNARLVVERLKATLADSADNPGVTEEMVEYRSR
ncbi:hypothetical protein B0H34DRAFT_719172 [Crassisporium funariophilum]|nr:hypothetical protein B0H34DRAFT_719172 [Crassisporium funariophilum]